MVKRLISLALFAVLTAMFIFPLAAADSYYGTQYVYTDNGKSLNVRSTPSTGDNIIGSLQYGAEVTVIDMYSNGWAQILWEQKDNGEFGAAYVQRRFLVNHMPASQPSAPASGAASDVPDYAKEFTSMNTEFRSARKVAAPYTVAARPSRASGWVNLRWAPSTEAERIATCRQGKELTVLAEMKNWYQVQDPETGMIGFISRQYVTRK
ncbi:MAG: SH3 domain-containing protein [Clostridia bacterium]|nr:SH3 domain-containing protein [Clostridia bacterium]